MKPERTVVIETPNHLTMLQAPFPVPRGPATVLLPTLAGAERHLWESRLQRLLGACGCEAGAICLLLAAACYAGWAILGGPLPVSSLGGTLALGLSLAVLTSVLGKMTALAIAGYRLKRTVRKLAPRLEASLAGAGVREIGPASQRRAFAGEP